MSTTGLYFQLNHLAQNPIWPQLDTGIDNISQTSGHFFITLESIIRFPSGLLVTVLAELQLGFNNI